MTEIKYHRLSADSLYHFTNEIKTLKLILKNGFRHSLNEELIPYKEVKQQHFVTCFSDILPEQSDYHRSVYGNYGISLKKEWGIKNGVSPVRYIHENSYGVSEDYMKFKNDFRNSQNIMHNDGNILDYIYSIVVYRTAREKGLVTKDNIYTEQDDIELQSYFSDFNTEFESIKKKVGEEMLLKILDNYMRPILNGLESAYDELERRDTFLRIYEGEFRGIPSKIFYDEREWRSVKFAKNTSMNLKAVEDRFLPQEENLQFLKNDINFILVETENEKNQLKNFITEELEQSLGLEDLVITFSEHLNKN